MTRNGLGERNREEIGIPVKRECPKPPRHPDGPCWSAGRPRLSLGQGCVGCAARQRRKGDIQSGSAACSACSAYSQTTITITHRGLCFKRHLQAPSQQRDPYSARDLISCSIGSKMSINEHQDDPRPSKSSSFVQLDMAWPVSSLTPARWSLPQRPFPLLPPEIRISSECSERINGMMKGDENGR